MNLLCLQNSVIKELKLVKKAKRKTGIIFKLCILLIVNYSPCIWAEGPKGLKGQPTQMTTIFFHALLPISLWEFDRSSEVFIRFGSDKLGNWNCDIGHMTKARFVLILLLLLPLSLIFLFF